MIISFIDCFNKKGRKGEVLVLIGLVTLCLLQVSLVLIFMLGVIVYKLLVYRPLAANPITSKRALQIANTSGAVCNLMCIMILSRVSTCSKNTKTGLTFHKIPPLTLTDAIKKSCCAFKNKFSQLFTTGVREHQSSVTCFDLTRSHQTYQIA